MKLYNANFSPNALRVRAVALELGIDLEIIEVDIRGGDNRSVEFLSMNPNAKVPVLADGDFVIWESRAINSYLASKKPERGLYPDDPKARATVDQWLYWQTIHLGPAKVVVRAVPESEVRHGRGGSKRHRRRVEERRSVPSSAGIRPCGQGLDRGRS